jgi:hypothetical protein
MEIFSIKQKKQNYKVEFAEIAALKKEKINMFSIYR